MSVKASFTLQESDNYIEYDKFLSDDFDANAYAESVINESETADGSDASVALSRLTFSIDSLNQQIQKEVSANYEMLLGQVAGIRELEIVLSTVQDSVTELNGSLQRLASRIREPYQQLQTYTLQLERIQETSEILRRVHRFCVLTRRLESQLPTDEGEGAGKRDIVAAALTLNELEAIVGDPDVSEIDIVSKAIPDIEQSRKYIEGEADRLLTEGVNTLNHAKVAAGLQLFYNLRKMETSVQKLIMTILEQITEEVKQTLDMSSMQKQVRNMTSGPALRRVNNEPSFGNQQLWAKTIWSRMLMLMRSMTDKCIKIYSLEKVLSLKKDTHTQVSFLDDVVEALDAPSLTSHFWRALSISFEKELKEATRASTFLRNLFVNEYPQLESLLRDFLTQVATHNGVSIGEFSQSPEYIIMMRSVNTLENGYRAKNTMRRETKS